MAPTHPGKKSPVLTVSRSQEAFRQRALKGDVSPAAGVTCEDDGVEAGFAPQLHEMNHIPEAQRRVTGEHDARLPELAAEVSVNAGIVLQFVGLNQLQVKDNDVCTLPLH